MFYNLLSILVTGVDNNAIWCGYHILIRILVIMPANGDDNAQDYTDLGKRVQQKVVKSTTRMILGAA